MVQDKGNFKNKIERWQKISDEAVKQCRRGIIPKIKNAISYNEMIDDICSKDLNLLLYENEQTTTLKSVPTLDNLLAIEANFIDASIGVFSVFATSSIAVAASAISLGTDLVVVRSILALSIA